MVSSYIIKREEADFCGYSEREILSNRWSMSLGVRGSDDKFRTYLFIHNSPNGTRPLPSRTHHC